MNTPLHQVDLRYTKEELLTIYAVATTLGNYSPFPKQWSGQKSGGDSAVSSEFAIAGMIFHPSRVKS